MVAVGLVHPEDLEYWLLELFFHQFIGQLNLEEGLTSDNCDGSNFTVGDIFDYLLAVADGSEV